jgi:hypothetical protein
MIQSKKKDEKKKRKKERERAVNLIHNALLGVSQNLFNRFHRNFCFT